LIGRWKGQGVPRDNPALRFRGWTETHTWAWVFSKGKPSALTVAIEGGKILSHGRLSFDPARQLYRLEGVGVPEGAKTVVFEGKLDPSGKLLTVQTDEPEPRRLTLRANSNYVRYTIILDRKEQGAVLFKPVVEVGVTKEGESFAAGSAAADSPRCIVTGGAATLSVSYQGQSYPICCTGCRDEFNENPEKYLKKLALRTSAAVGKPDQPKAARVSRFEDAFSGDVDQPIAKPSTKMAEPAEGQASERASKIAERKPSGDAKSRASEKRGSRSDTALRVARNLEKSGKAEAALKAYKQILRDYRGSAAAKAAAGRIKALEGN
jgi:YHS domain-containing protein